MRRAVAGATIMLADSDPRFVVALEGSLRRHRLHPERVGESEGFADALHRIQPDVVVVSDRTPGVRAADALRIVQESMAVPVLVLLERGSVTDELLHFGLGADDVVRMPASPRVVAARVARIASRTTLDDVGRRALRVGSLLVDRYQNAVRVDGRRVEVTPLEYRLLEVLAGSVGRAFTRSELIGEVMPDSEALERSIDVHIWNLRRKLDRVGTPDILQTVRGVGYRLIEPDGNAVVGPRAGTDPVFSGRSGHRGQGR